jgi:hypothetical protein
MIISWGKDFSTLGTVGQIDCPVCRCPRPEIAVVQYDYSGILWLFNVVWKKRFLRVCAECKRGHEVERASLGALAEKDNIPFMRKYGVLVLVAVIAAVALLQAL